MLIVFLLHKMISKVFIKNEDMFPGFKIVAIEERKAISSEHLCLLAARKRSLFLQYRDLSNIQVPCTCFLFRSVYFYVTFLFLIVLSSTLMEIQIVIVFDGSALCEVMSMIPFTISKKKR